MDDTKLPVQVYVAGTPFEAHFIRGLLESHGVEAEVRGEVLYSGRGEIPMTTDTLPKVWILDPSDFETAREVIDGYEGGKSEPAGPQSTWMCVNCGEVVESQFTSCWNCGKDKPPQDGHVE